MRSLKRYVVVFFLLLIGLTGFKILSCYLPDDRIHINMQMSSDYILGERKYPHNFFENYSKEMSYLWASVRVDTVTEYSVLSTAYVNDVEHPVESAFRNRGLSISEPENCANLFYGNEEELTDRSQYWMGLTAILRVLYCFYDMTEVREFSLVLFAVLAVWLLLEINQKMGKGYAIALTIAAVLVNVWVLPFTPVLNITFYLAMIFSILILKKYEQYPYAVWMFGFGISTAFFDWMSTPLVTYGVPMLMILLLLMKNKEQFGVAKGCIFLVKNGIAWVAGYALMIVSKWILGSLVLKINVFEIGLGRANAGTNVRIEGDADTTLGLIIQSLQSNFLALLPFSSQPTKAKYILLAIIVIILLVLIVVFHKKKADLGLPLMCILVGVIPYLWYIVLKGHCHIHFWFTYRSQIISIMAILMAFLYALDMEKVRDAFGKNRIRRLVKEKACYGAEDENKNKQMDKGK